MAVYVISLLLDQGNMACGVIVVADIVGTDCIDILSMSGKPFPVNVYHSYYILQLWSTHAGV